MKFRGTRVLCLAMLLCLSANAVQAQSELSDSDRASIRFDFNIAKLRDSKMFGGANVTELLKSKIPNFSSNVSPNKIDRVQGAIQAPSDMNTAMQLRGFNTAEKLPINFLVRIEFADAEAMAELREKMENDNTGVEEIKGKKFYSIPDAPGNAYGVIVDEKTIEMGTKTYLMNSDKDVCSKDLNKLWNALPKDDAIRISIDIAGAQGLVDEALKMGRENAPPQALGILEIASNMASLSLSVDLDSTTILTLLANGKNSESTALLRQGIDGLLGMAKMGAGQGLQNAPIGDDLKSVIKEILGSLKATADSDTVSVKIPKPEGMDKAISGLMKQDED